MDATHIMNITLNTVLVLGLLTAGCGPAPIPEVSEPEAARDVGAESHPLRRAVTNMESFLSELEGRLKMSDANRWPQDAAAAQQIVGNFRREMSAFRQGSPGVGNLESWLADLEGRLKGASTNNWSENAPAAQHIAGNIRIELEKMKPGL
jgi:hypothetical protein